MSDIYDALLDQQQAPPAAPAAPAIDIYDQILDGERQAAQRAMQPVLDMATKIQPERAASAQGLAKATGLPVEIVERNFEEVQRREQIRNMQDILGRSPVLARQMMDPEFAKLAHQDLEPLSGIEGVATFFKNSGKAMVGGLYDASAGVVGVGQSAAELLQFATKPLAGRVLPTDVGGMIARDLSAYRQGIEAEAKRWTPQADGVLSGGWYSGLSSLSRNLASLPLLFAPGGQGAALAGMTLPVVGAGYGKARDAVLGVGPALTFGASQGLIEYATELIPVTKLLGDLKAGASLLRMLANQIAAEIPGEQVATILQDLNEWAVIDANAGKTFGDYLAERPSAAAQTLIATIVGTAGQTTIISGIDAAMRRAAGEQRQAEQAETMAQRLAELVRFSRAAALTQTRPETFQQFVEQATEDGPVTDVFIDANVLMQSGVADQLAAVSPAVAEQLQDAIDTGGLVRIPVAEFAARIAPTEFANGLLDHLKTEPDGMSRAEAGQYLQGQVERLQQELGDTIEQTGAALAERVEVESVRNTIRDELNAINRFRPDVNEAYATLVGEFFGSMAQRVGMTPEQLFEKYRLRTVAESVTGGQQFDQTGRIITDTPAFRAWFGDSKVVDENGQPLVVYHGTGADITAFDEGAVGANFGDEAGFYFTNNTRHSEGGNGKVYEDMTSAGAYAKNAEGAPNIMPVYVALQNPKIIEGRSDGGGVLSLIETPTYSAGQALLDALDEGFDGIIVRDTAATFNGQPETVVIASRPEQIKSAIGNRGTYGPNDPNILHQSGVGQPLDSVRSAWREAGIDFTLVESGDVVTVSKIVVPEGAREAGAGTRAMEQLVAWADANGKHLALTPSADFGGNKKRLTAFYKRFGFKENKGKSRVFSVAEGMVREAKNGPTLYQFAGPQAATADTMALDSAKARIEAGEDAEAVRQATGWFKGADGKWRFEINDADARLINMREDEENGSRATYLADILDHPALFAAYPGLRSMDVVISFGPGLRERGMFEEGYAGDDQTFGRSPQITVEAQTKGDALSVLLHEIQHGIQSIEGFASGGNAADAFADPRMRPGATREGLAAARRLLNERLMAMAAPMPIEQFAREAWGQDEITPELQASYDEYVQDVTRASASPEMERAAQSWAAREWYLRLAGEVEARNTQARQRMTDAERRATAPSATADVADADVIVVFNGTEMASAPTPANAAPRSTAPRGSFNPATNTIALLKAADLSTFLHESGHFFLEVMTDMAASVQTYDADQLTEGERGVLRDVQALMQWFGLRDLNEWSALDFEEKRAYHEKFAESFELYLTEGNAPSIELQPMFGRFRAWLLNVYRSIKDFLARNPAAGALSDDVRRVFDRMLATDQAIKTAEQARSLMPLFASAQQAGMTEEEFAAYQALGQDATEAAQEDLGARGVRDMQWLAGARSRALKRLQKEAAALRGQMEMEARREVLSQPVYRAWQFLTGKLTADDRLPKLARPKSDPEVVDPALDSLFVAVAKLGGIDRAELEAQWGLDPKEKIAQQGFGKHVLRRNGGRSIDEMRSLLVQYGYLDANEGGPDWNQREFEDRFFEELGGAPQYSSAADFDALQDVRPGDKVVNIDGLMAGRLDRAALAEIGLPAEIIEHLRGLRMTAKDGLHPDLVAELFGFTSGDELVRTLAAAQPPAVEIEALTDLRMIERHGDLASPEALARAADRAIHNDVRARMVATELDALAKATGRPRVMLQAAREYARQMVDRLLVRNVKPGQYAAAEARAGKAATQAMKAGDLEQAAAEKRNQLVQNQAARAAHRVLDEIEAGLRYLKKFDGDGTRKSIDADYLEQIDTLLERFDLRKGQSMRAIDKRTALAKWIEDRANEGTEPDIPEWLQAEAARTHYKNLTVEQFRGLVDSVRQIEHLGRLKNKLLTARDARALDAIVAEIAASMEAAAGGRTIDNERRNTLASQAQHAARGFMAMHRQMHSLVREMDGYQDGGPLWNVLVRTMNEAGEREASMRADATRRLHALIKPLLAEGGKMGGKGQHFPSLGRSLNRGERLAIALNWGNEGNRQRLLDGRGWTAERVMPVLQTLTPAEWQFVQGVWDFFESYRPQVAEKEKRVTGKEPEWIEPAPFTIESANGGAVQMRGGYYPIKYDPMQSGEAAAHADAESAKQMMRAAYTAATTRRSYTKGRADRVMNRPLLLSFDGIYQGANEVIHDLSWHEWLIDANKVLRRLDAPMRQHFGAEKVTAIKRAMEDIARGDQPATTAFERTLGHLRSGATIAGLGWNLRTALLQPLGLTNSVVRVGPAWIARGLREFYGSPAHMARKVEEAQAKSEFLRNRMRTMNREINDVVNRLDNGKSDLQLAIESSFFILIQKTQALVDYPTWYGAFEKAMADPALRNEDGTIDEARAVAMADQAVIAAQSGGQIKDLAQIQRGGPLLKLFTNFYSYFAATLQLAVERTGQTNFKKPHEVLRLAGDYLLLMVVPVIGSVLINALMKGAPDDDEWVEQIIEEQIGFLMGFFPLTREMTSAVQAATGFGGQFGYSGPAGLRFFAELAKLGQQVGQGEFDMAAFKAANNTAGVLFHYPAGQVNRTVEGAAALIEGRTDNPLAVIAGPPPRN